MGTENSEIWAEKTRVQRVSIVLAQVLLVVGTLELTGIVDVFPMYVYLGAAFVLAVGLYVLKRLES